MIQQTFAGCLALAIIGSLFSADDSPSFQIATKRTDDRVELKSERGIAVFNIRSPSGISRATVERKTTQWPEKVVIQLRLKGLENVKLTTDTLQLEAAVSSHSGDVRLWKDGKEDAPLNSRSPFWMEIRMIDSGGKRTQTIPLKEGYFEMQLPKEFFAGNPKSFRLEWIDFYR